MSTEQAFAFKKINPHPHIPPQGVRVMLFWIQQPPKKYRIGPHRFDGLRTFKYLIDQRAALSLCKVMKLRIGKRLSRVWVEVRSGGINRFVFDPANSHHLLMCVKCESNFARNFFC